MANFFTRAARYCARQFRKAEARRKFRRQYVQFSVLSAAQKNSMPAPWNRRWEILGEDTPTTGFDTHYVYFPAWGARILRSIAPQRHVDISSTLSFSALVSAFIPVAFYDYRPASLKLPNLLTGQCDLTSLHFDTCSIPSLSCMHVVEHIGLGRYGDPIDPEGDMKAIHELKRVLAPGGTLLFVVPVGEPMVVFNAHRIYSYQQILDAFGGLELKEFALIPDDALDAGIIDNASSEEVARQKYGCGCFHFQKPLAKQDPLSS